MENLKIEYLSVAELRPYEKTPESIRRRMLKTLQRASKSMG